MKASNDTDVTWVTGASSGIGRALCVQLARAGQRVIASARNVEALQQLATENTGITALPFDVTDSAGIATMQQQLSALSPHLDRVILSAGHCEYLDFPEPDWEMMGRVMSVNLQGAVNSVQVALPLLRRCPGRGHLVGIASLVTVAPFPKAEAYGASKAALQYFLDSLRIDLACEAIDVTVVNPGFIDTPMTRKNDFAMPFLLDVEGAAKLIIRNILKRPRHYNFPRRLYWLLKLSSLFPKRWEKAVAVNKDEEGSHK